MVQLVMRYALLIDKEAEREIRDLDRQIQTRIREKIRELANNPRPSGVTKIKGAEDLSRVRVADHRIVYAIRDEELIVIVVRVRHRRDVYRGI